MEYPIDMWSHPAFDIYLGLPGLWVLFILVVLTTIGLGYIGKIKEFTFKSLYVKIAWIVCVLGIIATAVWGTVNNVNSSTLQIKNGLQDYLEYGYNLDNVEITDPHWADLDKSPVKYSTKDGVNYDTGEDVKGEKLEGFLRKELRTTKEGKEITIFFLEDKDGKDLKANYLTYDEALQRVEEMKNSSIQIQEGVEGEGSENEKGVEKK